MKKNTVLSVIAILLCFLVGYAAFQTADLVRTWIADKFSDCKSHRNSGCADDADKPGVGLNRR